MILPPSAQTHSISLDRRRFLHACAATGLGAVSGCENYAGTGSDPAGREAAISAGVFGFSFDWFNDGTFRLDADLRKVALYGMYAAGAVSLPLLTAGTIALVLVDNLNNESFVLAVASEGITGAAANFVIGPYGEFEMDITQFRSSASDVEVNCSRSDALLISSTQLTDPGQVAGRWRGRTPDGSSFTYRFTQTSDTHLRLQSPMLSGAADFSFGLDTYEGYMLLYGTVTGQLAADRTRTTRHSPLRLLCLDEDTIYVETHLISWDGSGREVSRRWWPFQLNRS